MTSTKKVFVFQVAVLTLILTIYFIAAVFKSSFWGNILSPINAFAYAGVLFFSYLKSDRKHKASITLIFYSLACFSWGIGDIFWLIVDFSGGDPNVNPIIWILYLFTNCFLLLAISLFSYLQFSKWNFVQLYIDALFIAVFNIILFWMAYLNRNLSVLTALMRSDFTSVISITTDIIISIGIFSWFLAIRSGRIPFFMRIISLGIILFAFFDMLYYYLYINGYYIPNSLIDFTYIFSFYIISFGALWKTNFNSSTFDFMAVTNAGRRSKWFFLLLYPLIAIILYIFHIIRIDLSIRDILAFAILIFL